MSKKDSVNKITNFLALSLCHKIGSAVNPDEKYSQKYMKEADAFFIRAKEISFEENWNLYDKTVIKDILKKKLMDELYKRDFLNEKKFEIIDEEIEKALKSLDLGN